MLRQAMPDPNALADAQAILIRCGAISYAIAQLFCRYQTAQNILTALPLAQQETLATLLGSTINPVKELLAMVGASMPDMQLILPQLDPV